MLTYQNILGGLLLIIPLLVFKEVFKKTLVNNALRFSFYLAVVLGMLSVFVVRLFYLVFEVYFNFEMRSFLESGQSWVAILIMSICVVGFIEEFVKASVGLAVTNRMDTAPNTVLLFVTCTGSALGFSFVENFQYYKHYGASILISRIFVSSTAHLFFVAISALLLAKIIVKFKSDFKRMILLPLPVMVAALCHGTFNFFVFQNEVNDVSGVIIALTLLFVLGFYEAWLHLLSFDENLNFALTTCHKCSIIAFSKARYCAFCGTKVQVLRKTMPQEGQPHKPPTNLP